MLAAKKQFSSMVIFLFLITCCAYAGTITINSVEDTDARDDAITLREAILLSEGDMDFGSFDPIRVLCPNTQIL